MTIEDALTLATMYAELRPQLGHIIRVRRAEMGLSQEDLAERVGVSQAAVSKIERGDNVALGTLICILQTLRRKGADHDRRRSSEVRDQSGA